MAADILEARVRQKTATYEQWMANPLPLLDGEPAIVLNTAGQFVNVRIGKPSEVPFAQLEDAIKYDQAAYVAPVGNTLPVPPSGVGYSILGEGTYNGDLVVPAGNLGIASYSGSWVLSQTVVLPEVEGVDVLNPNGESVPKEKAVAAYAISQESQRALPLGWNFFGIDRPDLQWDNIPILDTNNNILRFIQTTTSGKSNADVTSYYIDRPDLITATISRDGYIVSSVKSFKENNFGYDFLSYYNPDAAGTYNIDTTDEWLNSYNGVVDKYDEIVSSMLSPYGVTKSTYGRTGSKGTDLYYYRVKFVDKPKAKIILCSGTHANEKLYIYLFITMFSDLLLTPYKHASIQWIRDNCEVIFIPAACPDTLGVEGIRKNGVRTVPELPPINCTYNSSGGTTTVTYSQANFPNQYNPELVWNEYFVSHPDFRTLTIMSSDNQSLVPLGLKTYTVINGNTVSFPSPAGVSGSGTCTVQVWADPCRNVDNGTGIYQRDVQTGGQILMDNGVTILSTFDSKGTNGNTLREVRDFVKFINEEQADIVIDGHCPPTENYINTAVDNLVPNSYGLIESLKGWQYIFNPNEFVENVTKRNASIPGVGVKEYFPIWFEGFKGIGCTIEWRLGLTFASEKTSTDGLRWAYSVLIGLLKKCVIKK